MRRERLVSRWLPHYVDACVPDVFYIQFAMHIRVIPITSSERKIKAAGSAGKDRHASGHGTFFQPFLYIFVMHMSLLPITKMWWPHQELLFSHGSRCWPSSCASRERYICWLDLQLVPKTVTYTHSTLQQQHHLNIQMTTGFEVHLLNPFGSCRLV